MLMLLNMAWIKHRILIGYIIFLCRIDLSTCGTVDCDASEPTFLDCNDELATLILQEVQTVGGNITSFLNETDLTDNSQAEFYYDVITDVFCRSMNVTSAECFVDNLLLCPQHATHDNTTVKLLADTFLANTDSVTNYSTACSFLEETQCEYKRLRFDSCITDIRTRGGLNNTATHIDTTVFCLDESISNTTCVQETYQTCPEAVLDNNLDLVPAQTQTLMMDDQWDTFADGNQLCGCYNAKRCYDSINAAIEAAIINDDSDSLEQDLHLSQTLCSSTQQTNLQCATDLESLQCSQVDSQYDRTVRTINNWLTTSNMCDVVASDFDGEWECVKSNISTLPTCLNALIGSTACGLYRSMYDCTVVALKGKCGLPESNFTYVNAVFDMIRAVNRDLYPCPSAPVIEDCPVNRTEFLACDEQLATQIKEVVLAKGEQPEPVLMNTNFDDLAEAEFFFETLVEVVCRPENSAMVTCFVDNLFNCPSMGLDQELKAVSPATGFLDDMDLIQNSATTCAYLQQKLCEYKRLRFDSCITDIRTRGGLDNTATHIDTTVFCLDGSISNTTCVLETYQACPEAVLDNNLDLVPAQTQTLMMDDQWTTFADENQLCGCYNAKRCYDSINTAVEAATLNDDSNSIEQVLHLSQTLCSSTQQTNLQCATDLESLQCSQVDTQYDRSVRTINNWLTTSNMCEVIATDFDGEWDCVMSFDLPACIAASDITTDCIFYRNLYDCTVTLLKGQCGLSDSNFTYINAMFDMLRAFVRDVEPCTAVPVTGCSANRTEFLACDEQLSTEIRTIVQAQGKQPEQVLISTDFTDFLNAEFFFETLADVTCRSGNSADSVTAACFMDNLFDCPSLGLDQELRAVLPAVGALNDMNEIQNSATTCEFFQESICHYKGLKFQECIGNIRGIVREGETEIPIDSFCVSAAAISNTTCVIERLKVCPDIIQKYGLLPPLTQTIMRVDRWERFADGNQLCDCYNGEECFDTIMNAVEIAKLFSKVTSIDTVYNRALSIATTICDLDSELFFCAADAQPSECSQVLRNSQHSTTFESSVQIISNFISAREMCPVLSTVYSGEWQCVKSHLVKFVTACVNAHDMPDLKSTDCSGQRRMYDCVRTGLNGRCGLEYGNMTFINAAYDMMRVYYSDLPVCEGIKQTSSATHINGLLFIYSSIVYMLMF